MNKLYRMFALGTSLLFLSCFGAAQASTIHMADDLKSNLSRTLDNITVNVGDTFTVYVTSLFANESDGSNGAGLNAFWNESGGLSTGTLLTLNSSGYATAGYFDFNTPTVGANSILGIQGGCLACANGSFDFYAFTFNAAAAGTTDFRMTDYNPFGDDDWESGPVGGSPVADTFTLGTITVVPSAVPLPPAVLLFGTGLVGLVAVGRRNRQRA